MFNLSYYVLTRVMSNFYHTSTHPFLHCYVLGKGGFVFGTIGLFVCLSVSSIAQKVMNGCDEIYGGVQNGKRNK